MMFPSIDLEVGTFLWGVALTLFVFAFYLWWNDSPGLSARKRNKIAKALSQYSYEQELFNVFYFSASKESAILAKDIADSLKLAGFIAQPGTNIFGDKLEEKNIWVKVAGIDFDPPFATVLTEALKSAGLKVTLHVYGYGTNNSISIYVGPKE